MAKYKAKKTYKDLDNKHFGIHKVKNLLNGGSVEVTDFDSLPESIQEHLIEDKPKRARNKKGQLVADNPDTPDINEAYVGGKAPKKKATTAAIKKPAKKAEAKTETKATKRIFISYLYRYFRTYARCDFN